MENTIVAIGFTTSTSLSGLSIITQHLSRAKQVLRSALVVSALIDKDSM
jgi:hypothetical protein